MIKLKTQQNTHLLVVKLQLCSVNMQWSITTYIVSLMLFLEEDVHRLMMRYTFEIKQTYLTISYNIVSQRVFNLKRGMPGRKEILQLSTWMG